MPDTKSVKTFDPTAGIALPKSWTEKARAADGRAFSSQNGLLVIASGAEELDGREWIHLSVSRRNRLPSWSDLVLVKTLFLGAERNAYQALPDHRRHVNIHRFCLHLWATREEIDNPMPDFARGGDQI